MIPKLHYISQGNSPEEHLENIQKACNAGIELVQLGLTNVSETDFLKVAEAAREITLHFQTRLILHSHYKIAKEIKADGVYLAQTDSCPTVARDYLYPWQLIGGNANTLEDCETLVAKEVDYICLGPFRLPTTVGNTPTILGINGYTAIIDALQTDTPIIGVGGIQTADVPAILDTGISGIAVSEAISTDFNSIRIFNQLLSASSTEEQRHTF